MKKLIVIAGATASGKTSLAIKIAQHFNTKIISADSRQCYKELNIGVAKPSAVELKTIEHFFINSHSITTNINAGEYEKLALNYMDTIFAENNYVVLVGGTGFYINALCNGIDSMPAIDPIIELEINNKYLLNGISWLQNELKINDTLFYKNGEMQNPARMIRALVFIKSVGKSILQFQLHKKANRNFTVIKYAINIPREELYKRINTRVDKMMDEGLLREVEQLYDFKNLKNLQTVGYTELFDYLDKKTTLDFAIDKIKQNSRNYAKRQITWFKKDKDIIWESSENIEKLALKL